MTEPFEYGDPTGNIPIGLSGHFDEGLIRTTSPDVAIDHINRWGKRIRGVKTARPSMSSCIEVVVQPPVDVKELVRYMNIFGYYPSWVSQEIGTDGTSWNDETAASLEIENDEEYAIKFEAKFDIELASSPAFLYHVTSRSKLDKIMRIGLVPKSEGKISPHPARIYLAFTLEGARELSLDPNFSVEDPVILRISLRGIYKDFRLMTDPNFYGKGGYILNSIPPSNISVASNHPQT